MRGDERIRTAEQWLGAVLEYVDSFLHWIGLPYWRICDQMDLWLGVEDTPQNFPRRHGFVRLQHIYSTSGDLDEWTPCSYCGQPFAHSGPCMLVRAEADRG